MKTCSLELAKQLKEAGLFQPERNPKEGYIVPTSYCWTNAGEDHEVTDKYLVDTYHCIQPKNRDWKILAAPTTDELLEWLPRSMEIENKKYELTLGSYQYDIYWSAGYRLEKDYGKHGSYVHRMEETPADALAKLALWVKEQE